MANHYKTPPSQRLPSLSSLLLSPPEMKRSESFGASTVPIAQSPFTSFESGSRNASMAASLQAAASTNRDAYASPPISPDPQSQKEKITCPGEQGCTEERGVRDPQLFVRNDTTSAIASDEPLFPRDPIDIMIARHMKSPAFASLQHKPTRQDYELAVSFASNVYEAYNKNPRAWWNREREFDQQYGRPSGIEKRPALKKLAPAPSSASRHKPKISIPRVARAPRAPKRTPQARVLESFDCDSASVSVSPKPPRPATNRDDSDYNSLSDYAPPLDTLPKGNTKVLKADWKGQVLDLSNDPDRHMLHEAEVNLAATLRLSCATYLCSKRRIFQARIEALRIGKEFRKTDAQQACKIDVNKASKLWQAYDKVGWFKPEFFGQFL